MLCCVPICGDCCIELSCVAATRLTGLAGLKRALCCVALSCADVLLALPCVAVARLTELAALKANGGVLQTVAFASYVKDDGRRDFIRRTREELGLPPQRGSRRTDSDDPETAWMWSETWRTDPDSDDDIASTASTAKINR